MNKVLCKRAEQLFKYTNDKEPNIYVTTNVWSLNTLKKFFRTSRYKFVKEGTLYGEDCWLFINNESSILRKFSELLEV